MNSLKEIQLKLKFFWGSLFYLKYVPHGLLYSRKRDNIERKFFKHSTEKGFNKPGKIISTELTDRGANFYFELAELKICFLTEEFVQVDWKPGVPPIPYAIVQQDWQEVKTQLEETENGFSISSAKLKVVVKEDGSLKFCDSSGQTLREELPPSRKSEGWLHQAQLRKEEQIYGLGERFSSLNLRAAK